MDFKNLTIVTQLLSQSKPVKSLFYLENKKKWMCQISQTQFTGFISVEEDTGEKAEEKAVQEFGEKFKFKYQDDLNICNAKFSRSNSTLGELKRLFNEMILILKRDEEVQLENVSIETTLNNFKETVGRMREVDNILEEVKGYLKLPE